MAKLKSPETSTPTTVGSPITETGQPSMFGSRSLLIEKTCYLIRTVTYFALGRYDRTVDGFFILSEASWVADTGRFYKCLQEGILADVEPVLEPNGSPGEMAVAVASIVDVFPWYHALPQRPK